MSAIAPEYSRAGTPKEPKPNPMNFGVFCLQKARRYADEARPGKRSVDKIAHLAGLIYAGKHRIAYVSKADWYYEVPGQNHYTTLFHPENYYRFLIRSNAKEYVKSTPSIRARAASLTDDDAVQAARVAEAVKADFARRFRRSWLRQIEYRRVQISGNVVQFIDWDPTAGDRLEFPLYESKQKKLTPDAVLCYECGAEGEIPEEAQPEVEGCPNCGSQAIDITRVPPTTVSELVDTVEVPTGDWVHRSVSVHEVNVNASARDHYELEDVHWLRWRYLKDRTQAEHEFGVELQSGLANDEDAVAQRYQKELEGALGGPELEDYAGAGEYHNVVSITEEWLTPVALSDYGVAAHDHEIVPGSDVWLMAGEDPCKKFPKGVRLFHNAGRILRIENKAIRKHWQFNGWDPNTDSFWYSGADDAVSLQLDLNEVTAFIKTHTMSTAMSTQVARGRYIKNFGTSASPGQVITTGDNFPDEMSLDQTIWNLSPPQLAPSVYEQKASIKEAMQYATGALNNFNGTDQARNRTATQTSILEGQALAHSEQVIEGLTQGEARLYRLAVALWKENGDVPKAFTIEGEASDSDLVEFSKTDLVVDVEFVVEPGTVLPRRPYQERADFEEFTNLKMKYAQSGEPMTTGLKRYMANVYGLSSLLVDARRAETVARVHMKALRELMPMADQIVAEVTQKLFQNALQQIPPDVPPEAAQQYLMMLQQKVATELQTPQGRAQAILQWIRETPGAPAQVIVEAHLHEDMHGFYRDFINSERAFQEDPLFIAVIAGRMKEHVAAMGAYQADFTRAKITAEAPAQEYQMGLAQQAQAAQASGESEDDEDVDEPESKKKRRPRDDEPAPNDHKTATRAARKEAGSATPRM